jgi:hypothetical protein
VVPRGIFERELENPGQVPAAAPATMIEEGLAGVWDAEWNS